MHFLTFETDPYLFLAMSEKKNLKLWPLCKDNSEHVLKTTRTTFWGQKKRRTKCVKIIFISVSRDTNNIIHKNNVTRRSKALLTKCTISELSLKSGKIRYTHLLPIFFYLFCLVARVKIRSTHLLPIFYLFFWFLGRSCSKNRTTF
jgi:hypothetical protein